MKNESVKKLGHRALSLLLAILLMVQAVPVVALASVPEIAEAGVVQIESAGNEKALPDSIFSDAWNTEYDVFYYLAGENYTYKGQPVVFLDENTVQVGETSHPIKNAATTVSAVLENGKTKVTFANLRTPVGGIPGEWNSNWGGTFAIHGNVNGQPATPTEATRISEVQLVIDTPQSGSYTFTEGKIYEAANEFSNGYDFGSGLVTEREFGCLPDLTIKVEIPAAPPTPPTPPEPPAPPVSNAPFTAKIGDNPLTIKNDAEEYCGKTYDNVPTYTVIIPEGETATTFTLYGEGLAYVKDGGCNGRTWDILDSVELDILDGKTYHLRKGWTETFHIGFQRGETAPPALKVPEITAKIGDKTLEVSETSNDAHPCSVQHTYEIKVPENLKNQPVNIDGLSGYTYRTVTGAQACDGSFEAWNGTATVNEFGYHFYAEQGYDPDYQNLHITFKLFKEAPPKAPFSVTLGGQELQVDVNPPASEYGPVQLVIQVPSPFAKTVTFHDVKNWMYMEKNQDIGEMFTIETNDWNTEVLSSDEFFMLSNWPARYRVTFEVAEAQQANIQMNAQMDGKFLLPPETKAAVAPGLAKNLGFGYGEGVGEKDVTVLDALVKLHQIKYPEEDVSKYLTINEQGVITKMFGVESKSAGFMVNGTLSNTAINATQIAEGDTVDFFNYQDTVSLSDKVVWLEQNGQRKTEFDAAVGVPLSLTVKGTDRSGNVSSLASVQLAVVAADGTITPMEGVTDEVGFGSVTFSQTGNYTITVIGSNETKVVMPVAHVTVSDNVVTLSVEARTVGKGDFLSSTVLALNPNSPLTVKELLDTASKQFDLDVVYTENGGLQSVNGLTSEVSGWRYYINGKVANQAIAQQEVTVGDEIRIRYAVTATADELNLPLYQYLEKLTADAKDKLKFSYTQESKQVLQAAVTAAEEVLKDSANNSSDTDKELLVSKHIAAINVGVAQLVPEEAAKDPAIPDDFENDLWLQYDYKELKIGETASIYPRRVPQIIDNPIENTVTRPVFRFEIVKGDSVTLSQDSSREKTQVTAVKDGISVIKVSYDAEGEYGACSPINEGYVVFSVGSNGSAAITTSLSEVRSYDTIYYTGTDTTSYPFTVSAVDASKIEVTCNDVPLTPNENGIYTAQLENRSNVMGITAIDAQGNVTTYYQVVDVRKIQVVIDNKTSPGQPFKINDTARISFRGITMPVYKLATIYNPSFGQGDSRTYVYYQNQQLGEQKGYCKQYDLATNNSFEVNFTQAGDYAFTGGRIHCAWWGDELGSDKIKEGTGNPNMNADIVQDNFSWMPDFTLHVSNELSENVPVTEIQMNKTELTLKEGESFQLTAKVLPENATNQNVIWSCDDPTGFFITLDKNSGKITANNASTQEQPVVTVTATTEDGAKVASCKVVVTAVPHSITVENGIADPTSAARKTVVTIKANQPAKGQQFDHWEVVSGTINLNDSNKAETTFVMPDTDVTVKAVYTTVKVPIRKPSGTSHSFSSKPKNDTDTTATERVSNTIDAKIVNGVVSANYFEDIKGTAKNLRMTGMLEDGTEFTWTVNGNDIQTVADLKVGMSQKSQFEDDIKKLTKEFDSFRFLESGSFPFSILVEMPTTLKDGSYLLMRYNDTEKRAEKVSKVEVEDGIFKFLAEQGGEYFLATHVSGKSIIELESNPAVNETASKEENQPKTSSDTNTETDIQKDSNPTVSVVSLVVLVVVCFAGGGWLVVKKRKENKND